MRFSWPLRGVAVSLLAGATFVPAACSSSSDPAAVSLDAGSDSDPDPIVTPAEWDRAVTRPDDATAKSKRDACTFARGALPAETLGTSTPVDKDIPIETVVILMQENRSFDSYFGHLNKYAGRTDIESAPEDTTNPATLDGGSPFDAGNPDAGDPDAAVSEAGADAAADAGPLSYPWTHGDNLCFSDTNHEWWGAHLEYDNGKMDGFYLANSGYNPSGSVTPPSKDTHGERALWWYDERNLPFYYELAKTFAIGDHYHSSLLGPTWPNRMYFYAATSFGRATNEFPDISAYPFPTNDATIFDELEKRHVTWNYYYTDVPAIGVVYTTAFLTRWGRNPMMTTADYFAQAAAGTLPQVAFLDAPGIGREGPSGGDEHPPADIQVGQKFSSDVVHALMKSPQWSKSALFLTYDENGGIYDHLPPPHACAPDALPPHLTDKDVGVAGGFDQLGFRVPFIVVSPFSKKGYVSKTTYDHTSVTRFLETKFKVPALTARDANADPLMDFFDFQNPPFVTPPDLAEPTIDQTKLDFCVATYKPE